MKKGQILKLSLAAIMALAICVPGFSYKVGGKDLVKNGEGPRSKFMMKVYWASLWVPQELKGGGDTQIIDADQPMAIDLYITSGMITKDKLVGAIVEGLDNSAKAGYATSDKQTFVNMFNDVVVAEKDTYSMRYEPGKGLSVVYTVNGGQSKVLGTIKGIQFKKAFFGIYLSSKPANDTLKNKLLGK